MRTKAVFIWIAGTTLAAMLGWHNFAKVEKAGEVGEQIQSCVVHDYDETVEEYNQLIREKRFDEAIAVGKEAQLMQPGNPMSELMVLKAMYEKQESQRVDAKAAKR